MNKPSNGTGNQCADRIAESKRIEKLLQEEHEQLQIILDSIPAWIFYKDKGNRFLRVNMAFCKVMGMSREELEGKSLFDLYPKEAAEAYWQDDKEVMASGEAKINIIESMKHREGMLWIQTDKIPYRNAQGEIIGIIGFAIDITDRKNAEAALRTAHEEERQMFQEREQLVLQLQTALAEIKTLDSMLPICANCKKIRDEDGRWHRIETYISSRTDARFTHGYCPECADKLINQLRFEPPE